MWREWRRAETEGSRRPGPPEQPGPLTLEREAEMASCLLISCPQIPCQDGGLPAEGWQLHEDAIITLTVSMSWLGPQLSAQGNGCLLCVW